MSKFTYLKLDAMGDWREFETMMVILAKVACAGDQVLKTDLIYREITLDLDARSKKEGWFFSSCAYLPLWCYQVCGITDPRLKLTGKADNPLTRIAFHPASSAVVEHVGTVSLEPGDVVQVGDNGNSHVFVVLESVDMQCNPGEPVEESLCMVASYGAGGEVGGKVEAAKLRFDGHVLRIGSRVARRVLAALDLFDYCEEHVMLGHVQWPMPVAPPPKE